MQALLKIDIGSGRKPKAGYLGVDFGCEAENVIKSDALEYFKSLPDKSISHVYSRHFLEHIESKRLLQLLAEIDRCLIDGGEMLFIVPHFSNPYYYSDPTHITHWGVHSFSYFCEESCLNRAVPNYISIPGWKLTEISIKFVSMFEFKFFGIKLPTLSLILNLLINSHHLLIEFYERYFCYFFSIYEVGFKIEKK